MLLISQHVPGLPQDKYEPKARRKRKNIYGNISLCQMWTCPQTFLNGDMEKFSKRPTEQHVLLNSHPIHV